MMGSPEEKGLIPLISGDIFQAVNDKLLRQQHSSAESGETQGKLQCLVTVSYLEIYNETIKDLLNPSDKQLKIHEHPQQGVFVKGLCELVGAGYLHRVL